MAISKLNENLSELDKFTKILPVFGEATIYGDIDASEACDAVEYMYGLDNKREALNWIKSGEASEEDIRRAIDYWYKKDMPKDYIEEGTVKKSNGKWTNRGDDGTEHGEFSSKKKADAQRKAMYANGYKGESLKEDIYDYDFYDDDDYNYDNEYTVELYDTSDKDPIRKRFDDYKKAMSFANSQTNNYETVIITKPGVSGPTTLNLCDNGKWFNLGESVKLKESADTYIKAYNDWYDQHGEGWDDEDLPADVTVGYYINQYGSVDKGRKAWEDNTKDINKTDSDREVDRMFKGLSEAKYGSEADRINYVNRGIDQVTAEVLEYFKAYLGLDIKDPRVYNYANAVAEYIDIARDALGGNYTMEDWYRETEQNYPEEIDDLYNGSKDEEVAESLKESFESDGFLGNVHIDEIIGTLGRLLDEADMNPELLTEVADLYEELVDVRDKGESRYRPSRKVSESFIGIGSISADEIIGVLGRALDELEMSPEHSDIFNEMSNLYDNLIDQYFADERDAEIYDGNANGISTEEESLKEDYNEDDTFRPDYNWEMNANRFDDPASPYYNGDLEDDDFDNEFKDGLLTEDTKELTDNEIRDLRKQLKTSTLSDNELLNIFYQIKNTSYGAASWALGELASNPNISADLLLQLIDIYDKGFEEKYQWYAGDTLQHIAENPNATAEVLDKIYKNPGAGYSIYKVLLKQSDKLSDSTKKSLVDWLINKIKEPYHSAGELNKLKRLFRKATGTTFDDTNIDVDPLIDNTDYYNYSPIIDAYNEDGDDWVLLDVPAIKDVYGIDPMKDPEAISMIDEEENGYMGYKLRKAPGVEHVRKLDYNHDVYKINDKYTVIDSNNSDGGPFQGIGYLIFLTKDAPNIMKFLMSGGTVTESIKKITESVDPEYGVDLGKLRPFERGDWYEYSGVNDIVVSDALGDDKFIDPLIYDGDTAEYLVIGDDTAGNYLVVVVSIDPAGGLETQKKFSVLKDAVAEANRVADEIEGEDTQAIRDLSTQGYTIVLDDFNK